MKQLKKDAAKNKTIKDFSSSDGADNKAATSTLHSQEASKTLIKSTLRAEKDSKGVNKHRPHHRHQHHHKRRHHHKKKKKTRRDFPLDYYSNTPLWRLTGVRTNNAYAESTRNNIPPPVGFQYNTRQYANNPLGNYNTMGNNYATAGSNFVNSQSQFYGQQQQPQQLFYQGQNLAAAFTGTTYIDTAPDSQANNFNGLNIVAKKSTQTAGSKNYPAGFDIMSAANKAFAKSSELMGAQRKSNIDQPHVIVKKTNIPIRPNNNDSINKVIISASDLSKVTASLTDAKRKDQLLPNPKETMKEKDRIMSQIDVEPLSEFPPTDELDATRVEKNAIPRPSDFDIERHELVAKDSIYDIPNSHPIEPLSNGEGGLHSFFPGWSFFLLLF